MITIDRDLGTQALRRLVDGARQALSEGRPVLLFPEGTRKSPDEPFAFKRGVELLYGRLDVPVLPVVVNSGRFWGIGGGPKRGGVITLSYLPVIPAGLKAGEMMARAEQGHGGRAAAHRLGAVRSPACLTPRFPSSQSPCPGCHQAD